MIINPTSEIGKKVLKYLQDNPMTPNTFGKMVGIAQPTVRKLLSGTAEVSVGVQFKLEKFLREQKLTEL